MAHTFDIRFSRLDGIAALFEAPANTFGWKGSGRLSIDGHGISIAVRRHLFALFPRTRRVSAANLTGILREGEALRLEFATGKSVRGVVPFWVRDSNVAEEIVRLLPTRHTVELEHDAAGVGRTRYRVDWRAWVLLSIPLALIGVALWLWARQNNSRSTMSGAEVAHRASSVPPAEATAPSIDHVIAQAVERPDDIVYISPPPPLPGYPPAESAPPNESSVTLSDVDSYEGDSIGSETRTKEVEVRRSALGRDSGIDPSRATFFVQPIDGIVPVVPGMRAYDAARRQLDLFIAETGSLSEAAGVDAQRWWNATVRIYNDPDFADPALWALQDAELSVSRNWRDVIDCSAGCDQVREFAERVTKRLPLYVRD
jgi:hypothetical protein